MDRYGSTLTTAQAHNHVQRLLPEELPPARVDLGKLLLAAMLAGLAIACVR